MRNAEEPLAEIIELGVGARENISVGWAFVFVFEEVPETSDLLPR